ncbi:MAG: phosphotransferase [Defluviitaleaceae bacterium]|nr:phosphotransferase [Defluviitaleaceae bacterium]
MDILRVLNDNYPIRFDNAEFIRDGGSISYTVSADVRKYFLRVVRPTFLDTAYTAVDIQVFLQTHDFPVPRVIFTTDNTPFAKVGKADGNHLCVLYEYIEGSESNPETDAEAIGALVGKLHQTMRAYPGELVKRDKHFYIGRYVEILRGRQYYRADEFAAYGDALWEKIKDLPRGYCHGDMYNGNIHKTPDSKLYLLDFDTSCEGFPMYDPALICDMTKYFQYDERDYDRSAKILTRFLPEYFKYSSLSQAEIDAYYDLIVLQHFSTQATIMEIYGPDCLNDTEVDDQLEWLYRWREQCDQHRLNS